MSYTVRQFTPLIAGTSGGLTVTNTLKHVDDANTITIVITSSVSGVLYQPMISFYDPDVTTTAQMGGFISTSTFAPSFYPIQGTVTSSLSSGAMSIFPGRAMVLPTVGAFQLTILCTGNDTAGTTLGYVVKTIAV